MNRYLILSFTVWVVLSSWLAGCSPAPETLATLGSDIITVAAFDAYLLALPAAERQVPVGTEPAQWMEEKLRRLALERVLEASDEMARLKDSPEIVARQIVLRSNLRAATLLGELGKDITLSEEEVQAKAAELKAKNPSEPVLSFRHIFFRTDQDDAVDVRERATAVAEQARQGADFAALVRQHSQSANAQTGGLVNSARPSDLDEASRDALAVLVEDEVSPLIETRTGLHIFHLVRRLEPESGAATQAVAGARNILLREQRDAAQRALVAQLREKSSPQIDQPPWPGKRRNFSPIESALG